MHGEHFSANVMAALQSPDIFQYAFSSLTTTNDHPRSQSPVHQ